MLLLCAQGAWAQPFNNQISSPPLYTSPNNTFKLNISWGTHNFYPSQKPPTGTGADTLNFSVAIPTMGYNGMGYLGPTMVWRTGQQLNITPVNNLDQRTTVHWHGLNLPANLDGGPQEPINIKDSLPTSFRVIDSVQTVWYHSHLMDTTTYQVLKGLSGMILVESPNDPYRNFLPHNYDTNDFSLIIQEKNFVFGAKNANVRNVVALDSLPPNQFPQLTITPGPGYYTLINGALNSYLKVPKGWVRLRILNGTYRKAYQLAISSDSGASPAPASYLPMYLIATDGGYTAKPLLMDSIIIGPGERYEFMVNFGALGNNARVYLSNRSGSLPMAGPALTGGAPSTKTGYITGNFKALQGLPFGRHSFMAFVVDTAIKPLNPISSLPSSLLPYNIDTSNIFRYRTKVLGNQDTTGGKAGAWTIDGDTMNMDLINDTILVGTKEVWTIKNTTNVYHPFHIHKVQFQVLDMIDSSGNVYSYTGIPDSLPRNMRGYKDDVFIPAYGQLRFMATFSHYGSQMFDVMEAFMYHCHILTHEDNSMMHQFIVLDSALYYSITGTTKPKQMGSFLMYPNPASSTLNLKGESKEDGTMRITDVLGRTLREEKVAAFNGTTSINVADLPRGVVFVEWTSGNGRYVQKVFLN